MRVARVFALPACVVVVVATVVACVASGPAAGGCDRAPTPVAHRGGTELYTENTLGAFRSAGEAGVAEWELDIRFDVRGTPVLLHDPTVDRVSPATGPISELDATTQRIPTDDGQYIPTYVEVLETAKAFGAHVLSELKVAPTNAQWTSVLAAVDDTVGRENVTLMSFNGNVVLKAREKAPGVSTGLVHEAGYLSVEQVRRYGDSFIKTQVAYSRYRAEEWHAGGIRQYAWTVDRAADWSRLDALPIDAMITNRPRAYLDWFGQGCPQPAMQEAMYS